jgi:asparagine synthase (glutamine-hydrolysing)
VRGSRLRPFFKDALRDFLPREILEKQKHGFGLPFGIWLREHRPLRELALDSLAEFRRRGILKPGYLDKLVENALGGHASYHGVMVWVVLILELWLTFNQAGADDRAATPQPASRARGAEAHRP